MSLRRTISLTFLTAFLVLWGSSAVMAAYNLRLEVISYGVTPKTAFLPGDDLYVNIVLDNAADVVGCAFVLNYPPEILIPPQTNSYGQPVISGEIISAFPFSYGSLDTHRENSSQSGQIYFTGAEIDPLDGGGKYDSGEVALFRVRFRIRADAPAESFSLSLTQTELFDLAAGYGFDNNGNGIFDEGIDEKEKVSLLVGAVNNQDADWDNMSLAFPVLLDALTQPVTLSLVVTVDEPDPDIDSDQDGLLDSVETNTGVYVDINDTGTDPEKDDTDGDGLQDGDEVTIYQTNPVDSDTDEDGIPDGWEIQFGLDPLADDADADNDQDGITNLQEFCLGTDPNVPAADSPQTITDAGSQQTVGEGNTVILNGLNSHTSSSTVYSYEWTQTEGSPIELSGFDDARTRFPAPEVGPNGESMVFRLRTFDDSNLPSEDLTLVNVTWDNIPPNAMAGDDQVVAAGDMVTLDGTDSTDSDGVIASYQWTQMEGTPIELSDPMTSQPTFTAPALCVGGESLRFRLIVTDNEGLKALDTCIVNVSEGNIPPTAVAGSDQTVEEGSTVTLNGTDSLDTDDGIFSYRWTQVIGTPVTLSDPTSPTPIFMTPPVYLDGEELVFMLIVTDAGGLRSSDRASVMVTDNAVVGFPDNLIAMETSTGQSIAFEVQEGGDFVSIEPVDPAAVEDDLNRPEDFVYGLFNLKIKTDIPGGTAIIRVYFPTPAPEDYAWFKYTSDNGWTDFSSQSVFNSTREQMTLTLVDGGIGDDDKESDRTITDPSGLALISSTADDDADDDDDDGSDDGPSPTTPGEDSGGCFIETASSSVKISPKENESRE